MVAGSQEISEFEWDEIKCEANIAKHGIDFVDAADALLGQRIEIRSDREGEARYVAICASGERLIAVIFTMRGGCCRIISARGARKNEKRAYLDIFG
jgi:uncharacterized DUF497 family protein